MSVDIDHIHEILGYLYRDANVKFAVVYGSKDPKTDIDLLVVLEEEIEARPRFFENLDITEISLRDFSSKVSNFDIVFTEPVLYGEIILGNPDEFAAIGDALRGRKVTGKEIEYIKKQAIGSFLDSRYFRDIHAYSQAYEYVKNDFGLETLKKTIDWRMFQASTASSEIWYSIINLGYASSYISTIRFYRDSPLVTTLQDMLTTKYSPMQIRIVDYKKAVSRREKDIDLDIIDEFLVNIKAELIEVLSNYKP